MELHQLVVLAFAVSLTLTVLSFGLRATFDDALYLSRRPGLLGRSLVSMFVVVPLAVIGLVQFFDFSRNVEIILVALAISPIPPILPTKTQASGARTPYGLSLLVTVSLLAIIIVPVAVALLGWFFHRPFAVAPWAIARVLLLHVILPVVVGLLVRWRLPSVADRIDKPVRMVAVVLLAAATIVVVGANLSKLVELVGNGTLIALVLFVVFGLLAGHVLGGPRFGERGALSLASACRHPGIAFSLASASFPEQHFGGIVLLYLVVSAIITVPYVKWHRARAETKWQLDPRPAG